MQQHFLYYNIQCLDIIQMPRMPDDLLAFNNAFDLRVGADISRIVTRRWQLTNTRYLLGAAGFEEVLNQQFDPVQRRIHAVEKFQIAPKPGIAQPSSVEELTAVPDGKGPLALFEFAGALPRAKLYSTWLVVSNDEAALQRISATSFDPEREVVISGREVPSAVGDMNQSAGTVEFVRYAPKNITLRVEAASPSVLLLNDRYDRNWQAWVDGKRHPLLRCNYIMRGVQIEPGRHQVEFHFRPPRKALFVSIVALGIGTLMCLLWWWRPFNGGLSRRA
jgi:hypothetical protein